MERPSHSTIKVKIGTFKSGANNIQLHHWANAKPAEVRSDTPEAQMPLRGRPRKSPSATAQPECQTSTDSGAAKPAVDTRKINKPRDTCLPTRRSERLLAKNHATSSTKRPRPPPGFEDVVPSAGNSNQFIASLTSQSGSDVVTSIVGFQ